MDLTPTPRSDEDGPAETGNEEYDRLPAAVRGTFTLKQWMWLPDSSKARLEQTETEPEWD